MERKKYWKKLLQKASQCIVDFHSLRCIVEEQYKKQHYKKEVNGYSSCSSLVWAGEKMSTLPLNLFELDSLGNFQIVMFASEYLILSIFRCIQNIMEPFPNDLSG